MVPPKYIISIIYLPFCQFCKKVVLRSIEHGDVVTSSKRKNNGLSPQSFLANSVPGLRQPVRSCIQCEICSMFGDPTVEGKVSKNSSSCNCNHTDNCGRNFETMWWRCVLLQPLRWCCVDCVILHERDVREEQHHTYMWREQAIKEWSWREALPILTCEPLNVTTSVRGEWSWHVNSIVACCHSAKLCAYADRDFRSQQYSIVHTDP